MKKFLDEVAEKLYGEFGTGLSDMHIVFPGKRARLFFNEALVTCSGGRPMWQPRYLSIEEFVYGLSPLEPGDPLRLVAELYRIYNRYHPETFDRFYGWGEMLLSDFDTIDKYMIDASALYANISDLREIEDRFAGLFDGDDQAMGLVVNFWRSFNRQAARSAEQQRFLKIWRSLYDIYTEYKQRLQKLGIGYPGMIYRDVAESLDPGTRDERLEGRMYCFIGFNALGECEKKICACLQEQGMARFYWDYDDYYFGSEDQESGRFIRRNVARLGEADCSGMNRKNFSATKDIEVVSAPSDILQCKALAQELRDIYLRQGFVDRETVVVLTDESLLLPVLHSIPPEIEEVNVSMGYPMGSTVPYILLDRLLGLHTRARDGLFDSRDALGILAHPYIVEECAEAAAELTGRIHSRRHSRVGSDFFEGEVLLERIFRPVRSVMQMQECIEEVMSALGAVDSRGQEQRQRKEFLFTLIEQVLKLGNTIRECRIELSLEMYAGLLRQILLRCRVPYEGHPLRGLQVMGMLETRCLDFKNVIILSVTDDTLPGNHDGRSYIPFSLGQAFGLPAPLDHEAVYAYYFYRLLTRASRIRLFYSSAADDRRTGEQSRYIYQLEYESPHEIRRATVNLKVEFRAPEPVRVPKDERIMQRLERMEYQPTKINRYIDCPVKFYFADVEYLQLPDLLQREITPLDVGNTLHRAMEMLYDPFREAEDMAASLRVLEPHHIRGAVERAMTEIMGLRGGEIDLRGEVRLHRDIVAEYARNIVEFDRRRGGRFRLWDIEREIRYRARIAGREITLSGIADRIDELEDGRLRIVDYKSGADSPQFATLESLFSNEGVSRQGELRYEAHNSAALQTLLYGLITRCSLERDVVPALYVARKMRRADFSPYLSCKNPSATLGQAGEEVWVSAGVSAELMEHLTPLFTGIFDASIPFLQSEHDKKCPMCDYRQLCRR